MAKRYVESFCGCIGLRHGLLIWGYAKMVMSLLISLTFIYLSVRKFVQVSTFYDHAAVQFLQYVTTTIPELMDLMFTLVLIVAAHKKNLKMLELYYFYSITMLAVFLMVTLLMSCSMERFQLLHDMIFHQAWIFELDYPAVLGFGLGHICLQFYLMLLVRSAVLKLREVNAAKLKRQMSSTSFKGLPAGTVLTNRGPSTDHNMVS